ncbi:rhodanese-like domain-containing protein [Reinekea sp.]|jgi:rhodanese-related sulfurtransferase|uniref:rhodanese-like domain-containing protein n=1 Tax=Reinekea sp. TaxID=1970455 RepID=UPI00398928E4
MLEKALEFVVNHWILTLVWVGLALLLMKTEGARGGQALSPQQVTQKINNEDAKVIDIRTKDEFNKGHLPNAINIPARDVQKRIGELEPFKDQPIILICKTGTTAGATGAVLAKEGFSSLFKMRGGILEWQSSSLPLIKK